MHPLNRPEVMIPYAQDKFDAQGNLVDEKTKERIRSWWWPWRHGLPCSRRCRSRRPDYLLTT